jgi:signal-transduction protein with cAMP-binding, CBS, and nucleotidyltransferase domain
MPEELNTIEEFRSSPQLREKLVQYGTLKRYPKGDSLMSENSSIRSIPIVMNGALRVTRTEEDGREITLYYLQAGESCVMSILGGLHNDTSKVNVAVEEDAEILFLPLGQGVSLHQGVPAVAGLHLQALSPKVRGVARCGERHRLQEGGRTPAFIVEEEDGTDRAHAPSMSLMSSWPTSWEPPVSWSPAC